jgi:hypothetical protein
VRSSIVFLIVGDIFAIFIVTLIGFATHGELGVSFVPRMAAMFFPLLFAWFLLSPVLGLFQRDTTSNPSQLWRPALAMVFAAPLAAVLRGFLLNAPILPIFAAVLAATSALGMFLWRGFFIIIVRRIS